MNFRRALTVTKFFLSATKDSAQTKQFLAVANCSVHVCWTETYRHDSSLVRAYATVMFLRCEKYTRNEETTFLVPSPTCRKRMS